MTPRRTAYSSCSGDVFVAVVLSDQLKDFLLAVRQQVERIFRGVVGASPHAVLEHRLRHHITEERRRRYTRTRDLIIDGRVELLKLECLVYAPDVKWWVKFSALD
jgi:hypothetical protein